MPKPSLYRKPTGYDDPKTITWRPVVPVEPDPAQLPEGEECTADTVLKGGANHCIRPPGHGGSHLAFTYWGAGIGGD